jgi:hypothetical protein
MTRRTIEEHRKPLGSESSKRSLAAETMGEQAPAANVRQTAAGER